MLNTPFAPWPCYSEDEADAVQAMVLSNRVNYWTGEETRAFETEFARYISVEHAVAVNNGSVALELALRSCKIEPGDEVIVTPRSFIASVSSVVLLGAIPVFAEVDADSQNISAESIAEVITEKTKAIIVVHLAGIPADMDPILSLADKHNLAVIEDCAQAHGATYKGKKVGSIGDVAAWSFCQDKIMTTGGEGGMITTNDPARKAIITSFRDHGKTIGSTDNAVKSNKFRWLHDSFGSNCRMLEYQAIFGRFQIKKLDWWVEKRRKNTHAIHDSAKKIPALRVPVEQQEVYSAYYKCYVFIRPEKVKEGISRDDIVQKIVDNGVPCFVGACPEIYLEKAFDNTPYRPKNRFPVAKQLGETSLMFLVHPTMRDVDIQKTCEVLATVMYEVSK